MSRVDGLRHAFKAFFGSARLASAIATASIGLGVFSFALHNIIGWAGLIAILATLVVFALASLVARREGIEWVGLLPLSLLIFIGWATTSVFWSQYQWATVGGLAYLLGFTVLGVTVAVARDTIQIIRAFGDVLRFTLAASIVLEVLSGLLIDMPIDILAIDGNLDHGGPISGILGNRNELGLISVIGGISFAIEWRTQSVGRGMAVGSLSLATLTLFFTRSPIAWGTAVVVVVATLTLYAIRHAAREHRTFWQFAVLGLAAAVAVITWLLRSPIVDALNAGGELGYRLNLWSQIWSLVPLHPLEGWGWIGLWQTDLPPFASFGFGSARPTASAVNAYLDVWFQLGLVGLFSFLLLVGLAFVRSWLLAARQHSVIFTWPALVLAALLIASLAESSILIEFGWLMFVICCVKASQQLSWRRAFQRPLEQEPLD